ncbi:MAG: hypothetical protein NT013_18995, partial [Planctomycetia bacterium]|nr:hypothetical protein [Planctomycetia bacterium]
VMWLRQEQHTSNITETPFNETTADANFVQIELRSLAGTYDSAASAFRVPLATTASTGANKGIWRILRDDNTNAVFDAATENAFELLTGVGGTVAPGDKMSPGTLFSIATSDTPIGGSAALYIDSSGATSDYELVAPNKGPTFLYTGTPIPAGQVAPDLDLQHSAHTARFVLASGTPGDFLSKNPSPYQPLAGVSTTSIALQRRLNPYRPQLPIGQNPYVTVDEFSGVTRRELKFQGDSTLMPPLPAVASQSDASMRLGYTAPFNAPLYPLASQERRQPLNANAIVDGTSAIGPSPHWNTFSLNNQNVPAGGAFNLFQPHFDRDFSSTIDLFHVFINGPAALTASVVPSRRALYTGATKTFPVTFGQAVALQTEDRDGSGGVPSAAEDLNGDGVLYSNHFHRLLSLVEVPTRTHRQLGNPLQVNRIPGKINLNNVRDRHVYAALIDDREAITTEEDTNRNGIIDAGEKLNGSSDDVLGLADATGDTGRDWWKSFLESRDRLDPVTQLPLPITGYSLPFRDSANAAATTRYSYANTGTPTIGDSSPTVPSIDHTIMRRLPASSSAVGRGLFDLATEAEFDGTSPTIDPVIRQRLLSKIYANTTTRSNCFVVFATIGMFECVELPNGAVRIGGQMDVDKDGTPDAHRAIFIIDRSEALEAYDQGSGTFDWKKLIKARQRIN